MFEIKFKILDNINLLKKINLVEFESEYSGEIRGLFSLNFNGNIYGFFEENMPYEVEGVFEELLISWFWLLNKVVRKFNNHTYIALKTLEDAFTWIQFLVKEKNTLIVSLINVELCTGSVDFIATKPFELFSYSNWRDEEITIEEFSSEVMDKSKLLINFIRETNSSLLQSKSIRELEEFIKESQGMNESLQ